MASMHDIMNIAQQRIARIGEQEMGILDTQIQAMAERTALGFTRIEFTDKRMGILDADCTFGHGQEPSVFIPGEYVIGVRGKGAPFRQLAEAFGTLPEHVYPIMRVTTPNMLITPIMAARLFMKDNTTRAILAEQRNAFVENASKTLSDTIIKLYGTMDVIPFDYLGSLTVVDRPMMYTWRNIVGDIIGYRWEVYVGYSVLPARGMATGAGDGATPLNADVTDINSIGEPEQN